MNEQDIRRIVREEIQANSSGNRFGITTISRHVHNGVDSPKVSAPNVLGVNVLPGNVGDVMSLAAAQGNVLFNPFGPSGIALSFPTPVLNSEGLNGFGGGNAPLGSMILFNNPTILDGYWLYVKIDSDNTWRGIQLTEVAP